MAALAVLWGQGRPASAAAIVITPDASSAATAGAFHATETVTSQAAPPLTSSSSSVTSGEFIEPGKGSAAAFGNGNGAYNVSSLAWGAGSSSAHARLATTILNDTGIPQQYALNFHVYGGQIFIGSGTLYSSYLPIRCDPGEYSCSDPDQLTASFTAFVKVNGADRFRSSATVSRVASGVTTAAKTGTDLNAADDGTDGVYSWSAGDYSVDLGVVAAGASIDLLIGADASALSLVGPYGAFADGCGYGYNGERVGGAFSSHATCDYRAQADFGDPVAAADQAAATLPAAGFSVTNQAVNTTVPEPASLVLTALALGAAAGGSRRRRRR